jgi:signal peptidase I
MVTGVPRRSRLGATRAAGRLVARGVLVACLTAAVAAVAIPAGVGLTGHKLLIVVSGSMSPAFAAGDAVLVAPPSPATLRPGAVIAFHAPGSPQRLTTHRIVSLRRRDGGLFVQTKGDANARPDPDFTPVAGVAGVMSSRVAHLGRWLSLAQSPLGRLLLLGLPLLIVLLGQTRDLWAEHRRSRLRHGGVIGCAATLALAGAQPGPSAAAALTATGSVAANSFTTTAFCGSPSTYAATIAADLPSLSYRLGESAGTVAADASAVPLNGAYRGVVALGQPGAIKCDTNTAVRLDGSSGYISSSTLVANPTTYSVEAWFRTTVGGGKIIGFGNAATGASTSYDRHVYLTDSGQLVFGAYPGSAVTVVSPQTYLDGRWHLVDATMGAGGMALYVDGALVGTNPNTASQSYSGYWRVGYDNLAAWGATTPSRFFFTGTLDEVAVYPFALSASAVAAHAAANHS